MKKKTFQHVTVQLLLFLLFLETYIGVSTLEEHGHNPFVAILVILYIAFGIAAYAFIEHLNE